LKEKFPSQKFEHLVARFFEKRIAGVFVKKIQASFMVII